MPVGSLAQTDVETADSDASIRALSETMKSEGVGSVVITDGDEPVGIVTDRQIALSIGEDGGDSLTAADVMTEDLVVVRQDAEDVDLADRFSDAEARRLPVVDDSGELVGIVTMDDMVSVIGEQLSEAADVIEAQSPDYSPEDDL